MASTDRSTQDQADEGGGLLQPNFNVAVYLIQRENGLAGISTALRQNCIYLQSILDEQGMEALDHIQTMTFNLHFVPHRTLTNSFKVAFDGAARFITVLDRCV